ncbi:hypothetical protein J7L67_01715 [bacterium]|nr:hypothetical protein [bacterium]
MKSFAVLTSHYSPCTVCNKQKKSFPNRGFAVCFFLLLFSAFIIFGSYLIINKPHWLLPVSVPVMLVSCVLAIIAFLRWNDWHILSFSFIYLFLAGTQLMVLLLERTAIIKDINLLHKIEDISTFCVTTIVVLAICYLWNFFAYVYRLKIDNYEKSHDLSQMSLIISKHNLVSVLNDCYLKKQDGLERHFAKILNYMPDIFQQYESVCSRITVNDKVFVPDNFSETPHRLSAELKTGDNKIGVLEIFVNVDDEKFVFSESDINLIEYIALNVYRFIEYQFNINQVACGAESYRIKYDELEKKHSALIDILEQVEMEKKNIKDQIVSNIEMVLLPMLKKIDKKSDTAEQGIINVIRQNLKTLGSSFGFKISKMESKLAPREVQICNMIKNGLATKEISDILNISPTTVDRHRNNIRKKLGIVKKNVNLTSYLQNINI